MSNRLRILGMPIDPLRRSAVIARCAALLQSERCHQLITANPEFVLAARQETMQHVAAEAALVIPDGVGLLWAARRQGIKLPERITGVDLMQDLCAVAAVQGLPVFLLGGRGGVTLDAAARLRMDVPGLTVAAFAEEHAAEQLPLSLWSALDRVRPRILFVAYGQPCQELWIYTHRDRLAAVGVRLAVGVGGALDFLAGRLPRAPRGMRALGLEWLWRLSLEPHRLPRALRAVCLFPLLVLRERVGL